ncbi:hypothetical protein [Haloparvum sp. PAK95]|uniref:hypothetical protein n=1 Tax=Haloparvum sp. PAK95 TaxID=3418962 RepID=UPI003D2EFCAF
MRDPTRDPRRRSAPDQPTWDSVLLSYVMIAAIPAVLWMAANPVTGLVAVGMIASLGLGARKAAGLIRCFYQCGRLAFDVGDARVTVCRRPAEEPC